MIFEQYSDGKYRATAKIKDQDGNDVEALFTTAVEPSEVTGWKLSGVTTKDGQPVMIPRNKRVEVKVDKISISTQERPEAEKLEVNWLT